MIYTLASFYFGSLPYFKRRLSATLSCPLWYRALTSSWKDRSEHLLNHSLYISRLALASSRGLSFDIVSRSPSSSSNSRLTVYQSIAGKRTRSRKVGLGTGEAGGPFLSRYVARGATVRPARITSTRQTYYQLSPNGYLYIHVVKPFILIAKWWCLVVKHLGYGRRVHPIYATLVVHLLKTYDGKH